MTLLYLSLAYLIGISAGRVFWDVGLIGCGFPAWLWLLPLCALPLPFAWQRHRPSHSASALRWPRSAGFTPPAPERGAIFWTALLLVFCTGLLRFAGQPLTPCFTTGDLAYYNTPDALADDSPPVTLRGFVYNYPTAKNGRQQIFLQVESIQLDGVERSVTGLVRTTVGTQPRYLYGQPLQISGVLTRPPVFDSFDYRA